MKILSDSCFYEKSNYEKPLFDYLMIAHRVNKKDESFNYHILLIMEKIKVLFYQK